MLRKITEYFLYLREKRNIYEFIMVWPHAANEASYLHQDPSLLKEGMIRGEKLGINRYDVVPLYI
jgi:hypothetical protein